MRNFRRQLLVTCCLAACVPGVAVSQQSAAAVETKTRDMLKTLTVAERYYLLQQVRKNKPTSTGISSFTYRGTPEFYAPAVKVAAVQDGTYEPFGAVFDVMGSFGDAGSSSVPAAQSGIQTQLFGRLDWESEHFGYKNTAEAGQVGFEPKLDFSIGGTIGLYPAVVLQNISSTTLTIAQPNNRPMFQDAFRWTIGPRLNRPLFAHGEASAFANFGQSFLIDQVTSFKEGDNTVTASPVSNATGRAAAFIEAGLQAKILSSPIWLAHDDKVSNLTPLFLVTGGYRRDQRFKSSGDLAGFDAPENRYFFSFFITLTKIVKYSDEIKSPAPASVRFGVDIEGPLSENRIPMSTRFFVSANLDIMKIFRPTPQQ